MTDTTHHPDTDVVSVVIPAYNRIPRLLRAVHSVLCQTYTNLEVIVADDGSDIEIEPVLGKLFDDRVRYYRTPTHQNANVARNLGILNAKGKYIAMLDSDDEWKPRHIEKAISYLQETGADGLYGSLTLQYPARKSEHIVREIQKNETTIDYLLSTGFGAQTSTLVMTSRSARKIMWDEKLKRHQDYDFVTRYTKEFKLVAQTEPTVIYNATNKNYRIDLQSCIRFIQRNKEDISPAIYNNYHQGMLKSIEHLPEEESFVRYFRRESVRYKRFLTYAQYMKIIQPGSGWQQTRGLIAYTWGILINR